MGASPKFLALVGVSDKDMAVLSSLLELLADKMSYVWRIDNSAQTPDRILIDLDHASGRSAWLDNASLGERRVALCTRTAPLDAKALLQKPIRARELMQVLDGIASDMGTSGSNPTPMAASDSQAASAPRDTVLVRLKRWPDPKLIQGNIERARLSALLTRRALTLEQAAQAAQTQLATVVEFVELCREHDWVVESARQEAPPPQPPQKTPPERHGLFSLIRAQLGLRSSK